MNLPKRKHPRLKEFDYSQDGSYFVTLCANHRACLFGNLEVGRGDLTPPTILLSDIGVIADKFILSLHTSYEGVSVDKYIIMPNHIHLLITLATNLPCTNEIPTYNPSLHTIVRTLKTLITRSLGYPIWQDSYFEHIIRDEPDYQHVWEYIDTNPDKWLEDELLN